MTKEELEKIYEDYSAAREKYDEVSEKLEKILRDTVGNCPTVIDWEYLGFKSITVHYEWYSYGESCDDYITIGADWLNMTEDEYIEAYLILEEERKAAKEAARAAQREAELKRYREEEYQKYLKLKEIYEK